MRLSKSDKILITGYSGFFGKHLVPEIKKNYLNKIILVNTSDVNLESDIQTNKLIKSVKPKIIINLAAYSGGIGANTKFQADFFIRNIKILTNIFNESKNFKVKKIINFLGSCSYPENNNIKLKEKDFWNGMPVKSSLGYSMSKKMSEIISWTFEQQFKINYCNFILGNIYGEYDNFKKNESHVIPALIRKFYEAKKNNLKKINVWGSGKPVRDFIYAGDAAKFVAKSLNYNFEGPINVATGSGASIKSIVNLLKDYFKYEGAIFYDLNKPEGQKKRILDNSKMQKIHKIKFTSIKDGIFKTSKWFEKNYNKKNGIRL